MKPFKRGCPCPTLVLFAFFLAAFGAECLIALGLALGVIQ